jgi:transposase
MATNLANRATPNQFGKRRIDAKCPGRDDLEVAHKSPVAAEALERIAGLYAIEKEIRGRPPDERCEVRNTRSRPLLESLKQWFEETLGKLSRKSDTAMAVRYALGRWEALLRFCDDGRIEIDNNAAGTSVAGRSSGQKEFSFCRLRWR